MTSISLGEVFVDKESMDIFIFSLFDVLDHYRSLPKDMSNENMRRFVESISKFTIYNSEILECLLNFHERDIKVYLEQKEREENDE